MGKKELNITMASDANYADIMNVSMYSVLRNNGWNKSTVFNIIDAGISEDQKKKINELQNNFKCQIKYISFDNYSYMLENVVQSCDPPLPLITYARLYIADMVSEDQTLYVDCDMICCQSLEQLWNIKWENDKVIAGVQDTVSDKVKTRIGLSTKDYYINAGIILINLKRWRELGFTNKAIEFIKRYHGSVMHNDQGTINGAFHRNIVILPMKYNVMTTAFMISRNKILKYFEISDYYCKDEIKKACDNPVFIHFVRFTTSRPWEKKCRHPKRSLFEEYWAMCMGREIDYVEYNIPLPMKVQYFMLEKAPFFIYVTIVKIISSSAFCKAKITKLFERDFKKG